MLDKVREPFHNVFKQLKCIPPSTQVETRSRFPPNQLGPKELAFSQLLLSFSRAADSVTSPGDVTLAR